MTAGIKLQGNRAVESVELNETNWTSMVHLIYQILDGEVGLMEGCSQLCKQADEYSLLTLSCFDWFVQLDLHFDKFLTGAAAADCQLDVMHLKRESERR
ncbi:MAG: hypothetical protein IPL73_24240 [Candidatus Obscuribacter sp.]|nr:hypothetical protein [Candidatus Obscuribacter sp.]